MAIYRRKSAQFLAVFAGFERCLWNAVCYLLTTILVKVEHILRGFKENISSF